MASKSPKENSDIDFPPKGNAPALDALAKVDLNVIVHPGDILNQPKYSFQFIKKAMSNG